MFKFSPAALRKVRAAAGETQSSLGSAVGSTERQVRRWEAGDVEPSATYLLRIIHVLGCAASDLSEIDAEALNE